MKTKSIRTVSLGLALLAVMALASSPALAQTNAEINAAIQFNFSLPGARSLAMGGAFTGLADDATAAYTNPAGLTVLAKPEVGIEARRWSYTHVFADRGHLFGDPTGIGVDNAAGIKTADATNEVSGLSYLSFVYPKDKWAVAVYRHELANFEADIHTQGAFLGSDETVGLFRLFPVTADLKLDIVNYGVSGAYRFGDAFSLGLGVSYYDFSIDSVTSRHGVGGADPVGVGGFYGNPDYSAANVVNFQEQAGDDTAVAVNVGFIYRGSRWAMGGVYRQGPDFTFGTRSVAGPANAEPGRLFAASDATFNVPDVWALGFSVRPTDLFTLTLDFQRVEYSQLTQGFVNIFGNENLPLDTNDFEAKDANEFHVGAEYIFANMRYPLAVRLGAWRDPEHGIHYNGDTLDQLALFGSAKSETHVSGGFGLVFGPHFQLDAAIDASDRVDSTSLSMVARF